MAQKQVIVIRKDLNMRKGKISSQAAHASMAAILNTGFTAELDDLKCICIPLTISNTEWLTTNFKKITVSVDSEEELLAVHAAAVKAGVACALIKDSGLTEFNGVPTLTAVAVGPDFDEKIDPITGNLKLL